MPTVSIHGCELHVEDSGGAGEPILFLHGLLFDGRMYDEQVHALRGHYRCIAMDFRGQGRSAPATRGFQVEQQTADALALLRHLDVPAAHLVGLSMGGYVSMRMAARQPSLALSLTLLNTGAGPHPPRKYPEHLALAAAARALGPSNDQVVAALEKAMFGTAFRADPSSEPVRMQWRARWAGAHVPSVLRTLAGITQRPDIRPELGDITAPTLVIAGTQDTHHPPADARQIVEGIPGSAYVELLGVGHSATIESPAAVTAALEQHLAASPPEGRPATR
jgi:3-oxoadipate enol-lactonase